MIAMETGYGQCYSDSTATYSPTDYGSSRTDTYDNYYIAVTDPNTLELPKLEDPQPPIYNRPVLIVEPKSESMQRQIPFHRRISPASWAGKNFHKH